jgi:uncharacterized membrane protein HdeD (DUF308 family)
MNSKSRGWLITGAILSLIVGLLALSSPLFFSFLIVRFLGLFALISGVISLLVAIFDKDVAPRGLNAVFALVRIGAGLALLYCARSGLNLIMLIFAVYLIVEGIFDIAGALKMREHRGRVFMLINGLITILLGLIVYAHWHSGSAWILGLFFGINLIFNGFSQLMLGLSAPTTIA